MGKKLLAQTTFPWLSGPSVGILLRQKCWVFSRSFMNKVNLLEALIEGKTHSGSMDLAI